jgi:hypothetical protein
VSNWLNQPLRKLGARAAPSGTRDSRGDLNHPPDGWRVLHASRSERAVAFADATLLRMTDTAVRGVTRRKLLHRAAGIGVAGGALMSGAFGRQGPELSLAAGPCFPGANGGCGPSPLCDDQACQSDSHQCRYTADGVQTRCYGQFTCCSPSFDNCWHECCNGYVKRCCDCCVKSSLVGGGATQCSSCNGLTRYACICRGRTGSTC